MRRLLWAVLLILGVAVTIAAAAVLRPPVTERPAEADAIVVLGGGVGERIAEAVPLFDDGLAPLLVLSAGAQDEAAELGIGCDDAAVQCVDPDPLTTAGEARLVASLASRHGWETIVVVTSAHHVARARVHFTRCSDRRFVWVAAPRRYGPTDAYRTAREVAGMLAAVSFDRAC